MECCSEVFLPVKSSGTSAGNLLLMICHRSLHDLGFISVALTKNLILFTWVRNVWLIAEQISVCRLKISSASNAVVKNVPLKIYCWDRFVFQSVEIYGSSAKDICLRFHKAYTGCNGIAFYLAPLAKTVWAFFSDGSESNIESVRWFP